MGGVVSFSRSPEDIWYVAGWAFRQLLDDVRREYASNPEIVAQLESAELHDGLMIGSLDPSIAGRMTDAIRKVIDGILDHTIRSGYEEQPYADRVTVEQLF
jgi:hypothetical protein